MSQINQLITLPDGRRLGYNSYGPPDGRPVFYFHGSPSSRVEAALFYEEAFLERLGVRLVAVDRPGMGLSDFLPNRRLLDWPTDLIALADRLEMERFAILAYSLGGPYGLACARAIPARLTRVGIVSGAAAFQNPAAMGEINPGTRRYLELPRQNPLAFRLMLGMMRLSAMYFPGWMAKNASAMLPEADKPVVARPEVQEKFMEMVREALRQGSRGAFQESLLAVTDWGFELGEIHLPILLWHGEADQNIPVSMARLTAEGLPDCQARFFEGEGHLSLFYRLRAEILQALIG
jgi:pimeloyl-ACP methyl ester carboxylesterase